MTTSANAVFDLQRDQLIRVAYQFVGVLEAGRDPDVNQVAMASDMLNLVLKALQNDGIILRTLERTTTTLVAAQAQYTTASDTLDIDGGHPYVTDTNATDLQLNMIPRAEYMQLSLKATTGQPTMMYVEKGLAVSFFLYPTPDTNWVSVTYPRIRLLRDMDAGNVTTDLPSKYLKAVTFLLAADLAFHHGLMEKQKALRSQALDEKARSVNDDTERGNIRFVPSYGIRFPRRF